jgi:TolB-like protein/Flp pilus assembly protein TadD
MTAILQQRDGATPSPEAIRAYLARLIAAASFQASPRRRKLLEYVVEQTLAGRGQRLKAFDLAMAVLGRDERFDPQNDPIVRIEVGRLRRDLAHHYEAAGRDDPIRITIPKGRYVAAFEALEASVPAPLPAPAPAVAPPTGWPTRRAYAMLAGLCLLLLLVGVWRWSPWPAIHRTQAAGPAVIVLPFEPLAGGEGGQLLASGLTGGLIADLMRFDGMQVFAGVPTGQGATALPPAAAGPLAYVISGSVEREPSRALVTAKLTEHASGQVLWSRTYERPLTTDGIYDVQAELTAAIVGRLAQVYGVITEAANRQLRQARPATLFAYDCVQRAFAYRRASSMATHPAVEACLEEAVRRDPGYASAWAMLAFAHLDAVRFALVEPAAKAGEMQAGLAAAQHAVELAPGSVPALQALAALRYATGDDDEAERIQRQAIALNPQNPESLAQLGWRLTVHGRWQEGNALLQQAIDRTIGVPNWYHTALAVGLYLGGEPERARDAAEAGKDFCCGMGQAVLAIAEAASGHPDAARAALAEAQRQAPILARDPRALWASFRCSDAVIDRLNAGLAMAGLVVAAAR